MTDIQEEVAKFYCPEWEKICYEVGKHTDDELDLVRDNLPDEVDYLQQFIDDAVFLEIIGVIVRYSMGDGAYDGYEDWWIEFVENSDYLSYQEYQRAYFLDEYMVRSIAESFKEEHPECDIIPEYDHSELLRMLNDQFTFKFIG